LRASKTIQQQGVLTLDDSRPAADNGIARDKTSDKQWQLLEKLLLESVREQRLARRWSIVFRGLVLLYVCAALALLAPFWPLTSWSEKDHVAVVQVSGVISEREQASAGTLIRGLKQAFASEALAVVLAVNSPGGSPVQADQVFREIRRLRADSDKPVYAVINDIGASGAYYIAAAADQIYADKASLVGSIGVISAGFGFVDVLEKLGLERRVFTAGSHKAMLDAFSPLKADEQQFWQGVLQRTHEQFVARVKQGRGDRLAEDEAIFSGLIWSGEQALELGLIDGFSSVRELARDRFDTEEVIDYTPRRPPLERLLSSFGGAMAQTLVAALNQQNTAIY
jgi:protease-4